MQKKLYSIIKKNVKKKSVFLQKKYDLKNMLFLQH